ncbi:hypothetical protein EDD22DRAFT_884324 [Suillus occidentalis]|nr:hypothetical protein EDD22DRAFT_884324 [Suillus occidentalis]
MLSTMLNMLLAICDVIVTAPHHRSNTNGATEHDMLPTNTYCSPIVMCRRQVVTITDCFSDNAGLKSVDNFDSSIHSQCGAGTITDSKSVPPADAAI